jgi:hypothetical protein
MLIWKLPNNLRDLWLEFVVGGQKNDSNFIFSPGFHFFVDSDMQLVQEFFGVFALQLPEDEHGKLSLIDFKSNIFIFQIFESLSLLWEFVSW